jgi:hypothetical protein
MELGMVCPLFTTPEYTNRHSLIFVLHTKVVILRSEGLMPPGENYSFLAWVSNIIMPANAKQYGSPRIAENKATHGPGCLLTGLAVASVSAPVLAWLVLG